jgi:archaellum component FlaC
MESLGVHLCERHTHLIKKVVLDNNTSVEAIQLFYALKEAGVHPMLEWWDGKKSVDIAISRVKLNIEIDKNYNMITHEQAISDLEDAMHSFKNGFTTIRIPHLAIKYYLEETVQNILGIISGLKANIKAI